MYTKTASYYYKNCRDKLNKCITIEKERRVQIVIFKEGRLVLAMTIETTLVHYKLFYYFRAIGKKTLFIIIKDCWLQNTE